MKLTKEERFRGIVFSSASFRRANFQIHENTRGLLHRIRIWLFGECPACRSTHNKQIPGWNKLHCENCGDTWTY
jgi:hypothetical protein